MRFEHKHFKNQTVTLDCNEFHECIFEDCTLSYEGGTFSLVNCLDRGAKNFEMKGPEVTRVLRFLKFLRGAGGSLDTMLDQLQEAPLAPANKGT